MNFDISQGSVATFIRCGGILSVHFIANLLTSLSVKELRKTENRLALAKLLTKVWVPVFGPPCKCSKSTKRHILHEQQIIFTDYIAVKTENSIAD